MANRILRSEVEVAGSFKPHLCLMVQKNLLFPELASEFEPNLPFMEFADGGH